MIVAAAIKYNGQVYFLWPSFRHGDVFRYMINIHGQPEDHLNSVEGFIDDGFKFMDREEALHEAKMAKQIDPDLKEPPEDQLFSEDLW